MTQPSSISPFGCGGAALVVATIIVLAILSSAISGLADDEFKAYPGLWKTTLVPSASEKEKPVINWHCVDEGSDPWTEFAYLGMPLDSACKSVYSYRTSTSLKWRVNCTGLSTVSEEGSVDFTGPDHYTGRVSLRGTFMGYPIAQSISVEGKRYAACTSPQD